MRNRLIRRVPKTFFLSFLIVGHLKGVALPMDVALPEQFEFKSADGRCRLVYPPRRDPWVETGNVVTRKKYLWRGVRPDFPSDVVLSLDAGVAYFVGGFGDPGVALGRVDVYDLKTGERRRTLAVNDVVPDLETLSRNYTDLTNFEWISSLDLSPQGKDLVIGVCGKLKVRVHADSDAVDVLKK